MIINIFFPIFFMFLKNHRFWLSFQCRNEFCMQKYPNKHIFIGFAEKDIYPSIFAKPIDWRFFSLSAKKLISTNLAIFGFFPSKKHDSVGIRHFSLKLLEKITKNRNNDDKYVFSIFCMFFKNHRFWLSFLCRNEFCMQKYPNKHIFIGFAEKSHLPFHFWKAYSLAIFLVIGQKIDIH